MAGRLPSIIPALFACLGLACASGFAQDEQESAKPQPSSSEHRQQPPFRGGEREKRSRPFIELLRNAGSLQEASRLIDRMPPEQREKFRENFQRWQSMTPEEKKALRERESFRHQRMLQEVENSILQSGLQLDGEARELYAQRYMQERRKIEQQLQREMEEKRKPLIEEMTKRLQSEFKAAPSPSPSPQPTASPAS